MQSLVSPKSQWGNQQERLPFAERILSCLWGWLKELLAKRSWTPSEQWRNVTLILMIWALFLHPVEGVPFYTWRGIELLWWGGEMGWRNGVLFLYPTKSVPFCVQRRDYGISFGRHFFQSIHRDEREPKSKQTAERQRDKISSVAGSWGGSPDRLCAQATCADLFLRGHKSCWNFGREDFHLLSW